MRTSPAGCFALLQVQLAIPALTAILPPTPTRSGSKKYGASIFIDVTKFSLPEIYFRSKVFSKPALAPGATIPRPSGWITET
jgi:hypothetical protein